MFCIKIGLLESEPKKNVSAPQHWLEQMAFFTSAGGGRRDESGEVRGKEGEMRDEGGEVTGKKREMRDE